MKTWASPFQEACDMETPVCTVTEFLRGICIIASTVDDSESCCIGAIAMAAIEQMKIVEALRTRIFHEAHPHRAKGSAA